jgi:hypothetical protein
LDFSRNPEQKFLTDSQQRFPTLNVEYSDWENNKSSANPSHTIRIPFAYHSHFVSKWHRTPTERSVFGSKPLLQLVPCGEDCYFEDMSMQIIELSGLFSRAIFRITGV